VPGRTAKEQIAAARGRAADMRRRAAARMGRMSKVSSRPNQGVAFASLLVVMAIVGGVGSMFLFASSGNPRILIADPSQERVDDSVEGVLIDGRPVVPTDEASVFSEPEMAMVSDGRTMRVTASSTPPGSKKSASSRKKDAASRKQLEAEPGSSPAKTGAGITLLVVQESAGFDEMARQEVAGVMSRLRERGFQVISAEDSPDGPASAQTIQQYVEMAGSLRRAVGLKPLGTPDAGAAVGEWLRSRDDANAVLWITPERNQYGRVKKLIYTGASSPKGSFVAVVDAVKEPRR
jgi:hypothetical protein